MFQAGDIEVVAARWFEQPQSKTKEDVRAFCEKLAALAGIRLVAIDIQVGGFSKALNRYDRLRVVPDSVKAVYREFEGLRP